jgi:hypothetical protein
MATKRKNRERVPARAAEAVHVQYADVSKASVLHGDRRVPILRLLQNRHAQQTADTAGITALRRQLVNLGCGRLSGIYLSRSAASRVDRPTLRERVQICTLEYALNQGLTAQGRKDLSAPPAASYD